MNPKWQFRIRVLLTLALICFLILFIRNWWIGGDIEPFRVAVFILLGLVLIVQLVIRIR
jgi:hypothetical protein